MTEDERTELAWAAGFYDGEGCLTTCRYRSRTTGEVTHSTPSMKVAQAEPTTLERFARAVGVGGVHGPYAPHVGQRKPQWVWRVQSRDGVTAALAALWPYLSAPKRYQALDQWPGLCPGTSSSH